MLGFFEGERSLRRMTASAAVAKYSPQEQSVGLRQTMTQRPSPPTL